MAEYNSLLAKSLAALKTHNAIGDFDTLLVINDISFSPLLAESFLSIINEHNDINPQKPIKHGLVYGDWLEAPTPSHKFQGLDSNIIYNGIIILDPGQYSYPHPVLHAILDLKRVGIAYLGDKPNLRGVLQVVDHEDGFDNLVQKRAREGLGYTMAYHRILPLSAIREDK